MVVVELLEEVVELSLKTLNFLNPVLSLLQWVSMFD